MSILKLANAGDEATLTITGCEVVEGQYGEQVQFDAGDDRLYLPRSSADRQLERIGFADGAEIRYGDAVGMTLHFSRTPSTKPGGKPFWNINTTKPAAKNGAPKPAPKPAAQPYSSKPNDQLPPLLKDQEIEDAAELQSKIGFDIRGIEQTLSLYQGVYEWYLRTIVPIATKADIGASPESVNAGVATILIQATKK